MTYTLTVFDRKGKVLLNESFEANNPERAKQLGYKMLEEQGYEHHTHRCVSADGQLLLFHQ